MLQHAYKPAQRIRQQAEFNAVFSTGKTCFSHFIVLKHLKREKGPSRLGVIIRKKHVNKATARNAIKRQIKEAFRQQTFCKGAHDLVCVVRYHAQHASAQEIRQCAERLFAKL